MTERLRDYFYAMVNIGAQEVDWPERDHFQCFEAAVLDVVPKSLAGDAFTFSQYWRFAHDET